MDPRDALRYNEHPDELMREVPPDGWRRALRQVGREVARLDDQRTARQERWVEAHRGARYVGTIAAAREIVARFRSSA